MKNTLKIDTLVQEDGTEIKIEDLAPEQKYLHSQILDLSNKQRRAQFELDQVNASLSVFQKAFVDSLEQEETEENTKKESD
tara:strand:- start:11821 stop:12063 length:243 start_codon:yes stop_codon:yes gene_type:complete